MADRTLRVRLEAVTQAYQRQMAAAQADTKGLGRGFEQTGRSMARTGMTLTRTLTPLAAGMALVFKKSFDEWKGGMNALRVGTGATGEALADLGASMKTVGGQVTAPLSEVGQTMAELASRTDQVGKPLEEMTKKLLDLQRLGIPVEVAAITRLFGDWSVATEDQSETLDKLFRVGQNTGIGINRLSELMVQFGSPLRQLGLDFDFTAAMFARFEKEGVNIQTAMPGLRMALKNFAKDGREPAPALMETMEAIEGAATTAEANTLAFETFGVRAGPDLAAAIREGRFDLDELMSVMLNGTDTIAAAAEETLTLTDKLKMFGNRVMATIGPVGELGALLSVGLAAVGPTLLGLGLIIEALGKSATAAKLLSVAMTALPWVALAAGFAALVLWLKSTAENTEVLTSEQIKLRRELKETGDAARGSADAMDKVGFVQEQTNRHMSQGAADAHALALAQKDAERSTKAYGDRLSGQAALYLKAQRGQEALTEAVGGTVVGLETLFDTEEDFDAWLEGTTEGFNGVKGSMQDLAGQANLTAEDILTSFTKQLNAMRDYEANWDTLLARGLPPEMAQQIQDMGLDGAAFVEALATANDRQFKKIIDKWIQGENKAEDLKGAIKRVKDEDPINIRTQTPGMEKAVSDARALNEQLRNIPRNVKIAMDFRALNVPTGDGWGVPTGGSRLARVQSAMKGLTGLYVSSTYRPGAVTASGRPSYHANKADPAVDVGFLRTGASPALVDTLYSRLARTPHRELIWRSAGHYDHLHYADKGGIFKGPGIVGIGPGYEGAFTGIATKVSDVPMDSGKAVADAIRHLPEKLPRFARVVDFKSGLIELIDDRSARALEMQVSQAGG